MNRKTFFAYARRAPRAVRREAFSSAGRRPQPNPGRVGAALAHVQAAYDHGEVLYAEIDLEQITTVAEIDGRFST